MEQRLTQRIIAGCAILAALVAGWDIAHGSFALVALMCTGLVFLGHRWVSVTPDALLGGVLLLGYLIGNRGFAQLHPPNVPLLPAEAVLGFAVACGVWRWARSHRLPIRRDWLNVAIIVWILVGTARLPTDFRLFGFTAVRDFAMVYYAVFFFLAQEWGTIDADRRWLQRCLSIGLVVCVPVCLMFQQRPDWFVHNLLIGGTPLIYVKGDVAGAFMAAGALWFAERYTSSRRIGWLLLSALSIAAAAISNSRAAIVALAVGAAWLIVLRRWRSLVPMVLIGVVGVMGLGVHAAVTKRPLESTPLYRLYETAASVVDVAGNRTYRSGYLDDKPDNNQFRLVWWGTVVQETWNEGRWFGLGFGRDLAAEFLRLYYADANEEFTARSPHNFLLSVFGRLGIVGSLLLGAVLAMAAIRTWRAGRAPAGSPAEETLRYWLASWAILASACFGVVLEGPMGAVLFWTSLGLANARVAETVPENEPAVVSAPGIAAADPAVPAVSTGAT